MDTNSTTLPPLDAYTASSMLQKTIRRGECKLAQEAALTLMRLRGRMIWRRLTHIAYEDVGIGDIGVCLEVTQRSREARCRRGVHEAAEVDTVLDVVVKLAEAPKNREADFLICTARDGQAAEAIRTRISRMSLSQRLAVAADPWLPLLDRAVAAWMVFGDRKGRLEVGNEDIVLLLNELKLNGLDISFARTLLDAAAITSDPIVMMVPIICTALSHTGEKVQIVSDDLPVPRCVAGIPSYVFDKHTRVGKAAIAQVLREDTELRNCIAYHVAEFRAFDVTAMAAFYTDGVSLRLRAAWSQSQTLFDLGIETDMCKVGAPANGIAAIMAAMEKSRDRLDEIRCRMVSSNQNVDRQGKLPFERGA
jgi:hypothetical protein